MPADTCGFTTLESLDEFGSIDNLSFSLDSDVWATACVKYGDGAITSSATVSSDAIRQQYGDADISSSATITANGSRVIDSGDADISASATTTADAIRMALGVADISSTASVTGNGGFTANGACEFTGFGEMYAAPNATFAGNASINGTTTVVADLYIYGQEWTTVSTGSETWTQIG
jgi:hypothetical protein